MRPLLSMMLLGGLILCAGCIRSLHPIYTDEDLVFESSLLGLWQEDDSDDTWSFSRKSTNEYELVYTDGEGKQGTFSAHLVKINGGLFLDFYPVEPERQENEFYQFHLLSVHSFAYVRQIEPTLQMSFPILDWLKEHLADHPDAIRHERINDEAILTASPAELQSFWWKHLDTEGAFGDSSNMTRRQPAAPEGVPDKPAGGDGSY